MSTTDFTKDGAANMAQDLRDTVEELLSRTKDQPNGFILITVDAEQTVPDSEGVDITVLSNLPPEERAFLLKATANDKGTMDISQALDDLLGDDPDMVRRSFEFRELGKPGKVRRSFDDLDPSKLDHSKSGADLDGALALMLLTGLLQSARRR